MKSTRLICRYFSEKATVQTEKILLHRTTESNPTLHTRIHEGRYYVIPEKPFNTLFQKGGIPDPYLEQVSCLKEPAIMVRKPAIEMIDLLENTNLSYPSMRYVLYGLDGAGKSMTMAHLLHYASCRDWILVHVPWAASWTRLVNELVPSVSKPGRLDQPRHAVKFLQRFVLQNGEILPKFDLKISKTYVWSRREETPEGSLITELIQQGIKRPKYATDVVAVLLKELKLAADSSKCKVFVGIEAINGLFLDRTDLKKKDFSLATPSELTLLRAFKGILRNDWRGGAIVTTVDKRGMRADQRPTASHLPRQLLGKEGWDVMDPFYPVEVLEYSEMELNSNIDYFLEKKWLQHPNAGTEEGRKELAFLSGYNPRSLQYVTDPL